MWYRVSGVIGRVSIPHRIFLNGFVDVPYVRLPLCGVSIPHRIFLNQTAVFWVAGEKEDIGYLVRLDGRKPSPRPGNPSRAFLVREGVVKMKFLINSRVRVWRKDGTFPSLIGSF